MTGVTARVLLAQQQAAPALWHTVPAVALVEALPAEFPRVQDRTLARACVLEALARTGRTVVDPELLPPEMAVDLSTLLGRPVEDPGLVFVELMFASLEADPDNRDGFLFLLDLLRGRTGGKRRLQHVLQEMAARFPDDSTPWLELATQHYSKNAYRQAEGALEEARRRAPHDDRLLDLQAVGFLKSADQSRRKGRFALAVRDLERAENLGRRVIESVLPSKRLLLEIVSGDADTSATVARHLEGLPPGAQFRMLALLLRDLYDNNDMRHVRPEMADTVWRLLSDGVSLAGDCTRDEIVEVLELLPAEVDLLYDDRRVAATFTRWWPALLERVDGERLPAVLDVLMDCGGQDEVRVGDRTPAARRQEVPARSAAALLSGRAPLRGRQRPRRPALPGRGEAGGRRHPRAAADSRREARPAHAGTVAPRTADIRFRTAEREAGAAWPGTVAGGAGGFSGCARGTVRRRGCAARTGFVDAAGVAGPGRPRAGRAGAHSMRSLGTSSRRAASGE